MSEPQSLAEYIHELEEQVRSYEQMNKQAIEKLNHAAEVITRLREELEEVRKEKYIEIDSDEELPSLLRKQAN